ncbi:MAG: serine hydrolase, partial [Micrococcales bacterium]|nr:serine hydrolase [Micrococcales bacterium]
TLGAALLDDGLVGPSVLERFASPSAVDDTQGLGFRRVLRADAGGNPVTWFWHGGFTGTVWALDPESGTVVAGGATRLHGTTGPLPRWWPVPGAPDPLAGVASGDQVAAAALDAVSTAVLEEVAR